MTKMIEFGAGMHAMPSLSSIPFVLVLPLICIARGLTDGHEASRDFTYVLLLTPLVVWSDRHWLFPAIATATKPWVSWSTSALSTALIFTVCCLLIWLFSRRSTSRSASEGHTPFLLPARTSHTRFFPKKHFFSYSYLLIAVPIEWQGNIGTFFSIDTARTSTESAAVKSRTWFSIDASDYLDRGTGHFGLKAKLDAFLHSHEADPARYTSAWLVTAPRFLGYSFNPISFWYLYRGSELDAMVLEVNNTFDERRMYLLTRGDGGESLDASDASLQDHKFRGSWVKDFHVSPFNSRKGSYALSALEPSFNDGPWVDNTITLKSSKEHAKLVARIFSTQPAIPIQHMSAVERMRFAVSWFWVGFATSPRILREAARLFSQRKLHVWYRPEVSTKSIGRNETERERPIEAVFRAFLRDRAVTKNLPVRYIAAGTMQPHEETLGLATDQDKPEANLLTVHILTPLFYTHVALAPNIAVYMQNNAAGLVEERTFTCSSLDQLVTLLSTCDADSSAPLGSAPLAFRFLAQQRQRLSSPPHHASNSIPAANDATRSCPHPSQLHALDRFVLESSPPSSITARQLQSQYRRAATTLVLADVTGLGSAIFDAVLVVLRMLLVFSAQHSAMRMLRCCVNQRNLGTDAAQIVNGAIGWVYLLYTVVAYFVGKKESSIEGGKEVIGADLKEAVGKEAE